MALPKANIPKQPTKSRWLIPVVGLLIIIVGGGYLSSPKNRNFIASLIWGTPPPVFSGRIAFVSDVEDNRFFGDIYLMNVNEMNPINLTHSGELNEEAPTWSPDGKHLAFSTRSPEWNVFPPSPADLYVMNADGTKPINLTQSDKADEVSPAWSPDGKYIAFSKSSNVSPNDHSPADLYVMNADGTNPINLTHNQVYAHDPVWVR